MAEMKENQMEMCDQQEKERSETSFLDFPDEIITQVMEKLDIASCLKLRVNRRLNELQLAVKNELKRIYVDIHATGYEVDVVGSNTCFSFESTDFESLEKGLHRLALNTRVEDISMNMIVMPDEEHCRIADAFLNFEANRCFFDSNNSEGTDLWNLPQISPTNFHTIAKNFAEFSSPYIDCSSLTAQDFLIIRKAMLEDDCKLRSFNMKMEEGMFKPFIEACFGVTIVDYPGPIRGRIYRATDESVELYSHPNGGPYSHMEGDLEMTMHVDDSYCRLVLTKYDAWEINWFDKRKSDLHKVQMNHVYIVQ